MLLPAWNINCEGQDVHIVITIIEEVIQLLILHETIWELGDLEPHDQSLI